MYSDGTHIYRAVPRLNLTATEIQPLCCGKLNIFQHLVDNVSPHETRHGKPNASPEAKAAKRATLYYIEHILFNDKSNFYHKVASKKLMSTIYSRPPAILQQLFINLILKWCRAVFFTRLPCSTETERGHWCALNLSYSWIFRLMGGGQQKTRGILLYNKYNTINENLGTLQKLSDNKGWMLSIKYIPIFGVVLSTPCRQPFINYKSQ